MNSATKTIKQSKLPPGRSIQPKNITIGKQSEIEKKKRKLEENDNNPDNITEQNIINNNMSTSYSSSSESSETSDSEEDFNEIKTNNNNNAKRSKNNSGSENVYKHSQTTNSNATTNSIPIKPTNSILIPNPRVDCNSGRLYTVSIALPGSIISNAQSCELRSYLAGQIARAASIFNVDEIIVFSENTSSSINSSSIEGEFRGANRHSDPDVFLARLLQYLETPQYLRKSLFPVHPDLQYAGLINPLDTPHHLRANQDSLYREGVVLNRPVKSGSKGSWVNAGIKSEVQIDRTLPAGVRLTVKLNKAVGSSKLLKNVSGIAVSPSEPREKYGIYWGYTTRLAASLTKVWTESPYKTGYDCSIGTSDKGKDIQNLNIPPFQTAENNNPNRLPPFQHLLIVFGGLYGLEESIESDIDCTAKDPSELFDFYINAVCNQGSRTIRTEEAIPITLSVLQPYIRLNKPIKLE